MIVDDEPFNHSTLKMIFSRICKAKFHSMYNGLEAVNFVTELVKNQDSSVKAILMDIDMPVMDGLKVFQYK